MIRFLMTAAALIGSIAAAFVAPGGATSIGWRIQAAILADPLEHLTVPADRLPLGCAFGPRSEILDSGRVQVWSWPFPKNPWIGTDRSLLASIRRLMWGPPLMPDGPPLSPIEAQRYSRRSADGLEAGYAAFYYSKPHDERFSVYALRVAAAAAVDDVAPRDHLEAQRIRIGRIVAMVFGRENPGDCLTAVNRHLRSLAR